MISKEIFDRILALHIDIEECLNDEYLRAAMSEFEMKKLIPKLLKMNCAYDFDAFVVAAGRHRCSFVEELNISEYKVQEWDVHGFYIYDKENLMFQFATNFLENQRYRFCNCCEEVYFSKEEFPKLCPKCINDRLSALNEYDSNDEET